jgi:hypothetical protein
MNFFKFITRSKRTLELDGSFEAWDGILHPVKQIPSKKCGVETLIKLGATKRKSPLSFSVGEHGIVLHDIQMFDCISFFEGRSVSVFQVLESETPGYGRLVFVRDERLEEQPGNSVYGGRAGKYNQAP